METVDVKFNVLSLDIDAATAEVEFVNYGGPIETGAETVESLAVVIEINTGDFNDDGSPVTRTESVPPKNPNGNITRILQVFANDNNTDISAANIVDSVSLQYPYDEFTRANAILSFSVDAGTSVGAHTVLVEKHLVDVETETETVEPMNGLVPHLFAPLSDLEVFKAVTNTFPVVPKELVDKFIASHTYTNFDMSHEYNGLGAVAGLLFDAPLKLESTTASALEVRRNQDQLNIDAHEWGLPMFITLTDGAPLIDKEAFTASLVDLYGYEVTVGATANYLTRPITVALMANRKRKLLELARDEESNAAVAVKIGGVYHSFDNNEESRRNINEALTLFLTLPADIVWRSANNENVPVTRDDLVSISTAMGVVKETAYKDSWVKKAVVDAIEASNDTAEIKIVNIDAI